MENLHNLLEILVPLVDNESTECIRQLFHDKNGGNVQVPIDSDAKGNKFNS